MKLHTSHLKKSIENADIKTGENALAEHASTNQCLRKYSLEQSPLRINRSRKIRHGTTAAARTIIILAVENSC